MGKQTRKSGSHFGGEWTEEKLTIIRKYLSFYVNALKNIKAMENVFLNNGVKLVSGGSDNHMLLINVKDSFGVTGKEAEKILEGVGIACNKNMIAFDTLKPSVTSGIRIGEASLITLDDIDFTNNIILIHGKGRKQRLIYISSIETISNLKKYLEIRNERNCESNYLFVNKNGSQISINSIDNIYRKYKKKAKINKHSTPHSLRHTFATNLLANGADIRSVQEILGHSNVSITERYTEVTTKRKVEVLSKYNYRNSL